MTNATTRSRERERINKNIRRFSETSVTRWLDYLLSIWPFRTILKSCQSSLEMLQNTQKTLINVAKDFKVLPKWQIFAK